ALTYFPSRSLLQEPSNEGLVFRDLVFRAEDGPQLHGWWLPTPLREDRLGQLLFCHGNAGNIGDRLVEARILTAAGFDVLLFDYRGYGRSEGRPDEHGTYRDARAAHRALLEQCDPDPERVIYLGESLGGAVALRLAVEHPPAGLILQSTFTSVRDIARHHYPFVPPAIIPNWYASGDLISHLRTSVLVLHGDRDQIVPVSHAESLYNAAPEPKRMHVFSGLGHNDLVTRSAAQYADVIVSWAQDLPRARATSQTIS
ncbi:MAG: alpha/beta hydrolase, partial [Solirubrobacterales bacterium]|nr:alpha/beta hydrolase [Solirubrobacterales bacterium]